MAEDLNSFRGTSIRTRLLLTFVLLMLLPTIAMSISGIVVVMRAARQDTVDQLNSVATLKDSEISNWVNQRESELGILLNDPATAQPIVTLLHAPVGSPSYAQAAALLDQRARDFVEHTNCFEQIDLINPQGRVAWSTQPGSVGRSYGFSPHFRQALQSPVSFVCAGTAGEGSEPRDAVVVLRPVIGPQGRVQGIFGGHASQTWLNQIMSEHAGLGRTGETYLVSPDHILLTDSRFPGYRSGVSRVNSRGVDLALATHGKGAATYRDYRQQPVIGVYRWLPELQADLLVEQEQAEWLAPMYMAMKISLIIAAAAILLAVTAALLINRSIVRPLRRLASAAQRIASGANSLTLPVPIDRRDEIGVLARSFNDMTARLGTMMASEKAARAEAEAANRAKDEFLTVLSHELRTPLTAILGWAQMLRKGIVDAAEVPHALDIIERNAWEQSQIVKDLLDVSSIIRGTIRLEEQPVDLVELTHSVIESVMLSARVRSIHIGRELESCPVMIYGDAGRLRQIVWNLLSNAVKFTPEGGNITVSLHPADAHACLVIADTGIGITSDFLPYVFDRFRQADSSRTRKYGGLGIGLAIVRHLVELHGGTISAQSAGRGQGATFTLRFPLMPVPPGPRPPSQPVPPPPAAPAADRALAGIRVLVVDDEPDARELLTRVLKRAGASAATAGSAGEALDVMDQWKPDVLLSDIAMPGEDGYDLIHKVRSRSPEHGGRVPAAALTAMAGTEDRTRALSAGYQLHVPKPVEPSELVTVVATLAHWIGPE